MANVKVDKLATFLSRNKFEMEGWPQSWKYDSIRGDYKSTEQGVGAERHFPGRTSFFYITWKSIVFLVFSRGVSRADNSEAQL
jgi:hypothetical protein